MNVENFVKGVEKDMERTYFMRFSETFIDEGGNERSIPLLINTCLNRNSNSYDFVESLYEWYNTKGFLTERQIRSLLKIERYNC